MRIRLMLLWLCLATSVGLVGCSGEPPEAPLKTTINKLNSPDAKTRLEGVEDAHRELGEKQ